MSATCSGVQPNDPNELSVVVYQYQPELYFLVALAAALLYSILTTLDKEVKYFWKPQLKFVDALFYTIRYTGLFSSVVTLYWYYAFQANEKSVNVSSNRLALNDQPRTEILTTIGNVSQWGEDLGDCIVLLLADHILLMRVLALSSRDEKLVVLLRATFFAEAIVMLASLIYKEVNEKVDVGGTEGYAFCGENGTNSPVALTLFWSTPLLFELVMMIVALFKASEYWRITIGFSGFSLVKVLIQDQVIYFLSISMCNIIHVTDYWAFLPGGFSSSQFINTAIKIAGASAFLCIIGSQLMFHLEEAAEKGSMEELAIGPEP